MRVTHYLAVVLMMVHLSIQQNEPLDNVYVVTIGDWIKPCKEYTGRSYHIYPGTDCKDWYVCENGKRIEVAYCFNGTTFSYVTRKCEHGIKCFLEENPHALGIFTKLKIAAYVLSLFLGHNSNVLPEPEKPTFVAPGEPNFHSLSKRFAAPEKPITVPRTTSTTVPPITTPDPRESLEKFDFVKGFVFPLAQRIMSDPILLPTLSSIVSTTFEQNVPGANRYYTAAHENLTFSKDYIPRKELLQSMRHVLDRITPAMKSILMLRMPGIAKVMESNSELLADIIKEMKAKLSPLAEDLFDLLKRYAEAAFVTRNEEFYLANIHKDIDSFVTLVYVVVRNLFYDLYEEKIETSFISV